LNTPAGTVELRTGKLRPHRREDLITKSTVVGPGGACPLWHGFLDRVTGGDSELQAFLRRVAGYALTGETRDHALFFAHGSGRNGKGVFLNTLSWVLSDYAAVAAMETFVASAGDRHSTDVAMLRGARLVTAQETQEGRSWDEPKIKSLTGGDPITARFMRQDNFTFLPQFKLIIAGNHKPSLRNVDEAIRARFHLIPFAVTIPEDERDPRLPEKLRAEAGGILAWAIQGCLDWQRNGLNPPDSVRAATEKYLEEEDQFGAWLDDCCGRDRHGWESVAELFGSWTTWAEKAGERPWTKKRLGQALENRGFEAGKQQGQRGYFGIHLTRPDYGDECWK
jgi:putative DNA primase/helicase